VRANGNGSASIAPKGALTTAHANTFNSVCDSHQVGRNIVIASMRMLRKLWLAVVPCILRQRDIDRGGRARLLHRGAPCQCVALNIRNQQRVLQA
jgi:hypothetical protein